MSLPEYVWVEPLGMWMENGHAKGSSTAERECQALEIIVDELDAHCRRVAHTARPGAIFRANRVFQLALGEYNRLQNLCTAEQRQRAAVYLQKLQHTDYFRRESKRLDVVNAMISEHLELMRQHERKKRNGRQPA